MRRIDAIREQLSDSQFDEEPARVIRELLVVAVTASGVCLRKCYNCMEIDHAAQCSWCELQPIAGVLAPLLEEVEG